jgi:hypothetical protein
MKNPLHLRETLRLSALVTAFALLAGCSYDVEAPLWEKPYTIPATPVITGVQPGLAPAGVNTIQIVGHNLNGVPAANGVYFGITPVEVVSKSSTSIIVRRPNLVADSCTVKVVSDSALVVARASFGKIDQVMTRFGKFADAVPLAVVSADSIGNTIVVSGLTPIIIWRITPDETRTTIPTSGLTLRPPTDGVVRHGEVYLTGNNREIQRVNLTTGVAARWTQLPSGKIAKCGDFDTSGYFYAGGALGVDLCIIPLNPTSTLTLAQIKLSGFYATEEVLAIRYFNGSLYVASRLSGTSPVRVWKHAVSSGGTLGTQQMVADLGSNAALAASTVRAISFSAAGMLYLTTDDISPMVVCDPASGAVEQFYKGIVPPHGKLAYWGNGSTLYMISGDVDNSDPSLRWNIIRVAMGTSGPGI